MPELPEVEFTARQLRATIIGATIRDAQVFWARTVGHPDLAQFFAEVAGLRVVDVRRRAKYILLDLASQAEPDNRPDFLLTFHRRMTGNLYLLPPGWGIDTGLCESDPVLWNVKGPLAIPPAEAGENGVYHDTRYDPAELRYCRVCFNFTDGRRLLFNDQRKFGRIELWPGEQEAVALEGLGPEPLDEAFTVEVLARGLASRKGAIKTVLLAQEVIAGLGNIYADEALFSASIHPLRPANSLTPAELEKLHAGITAVLALGIHHGGTTFSGYRGLQGEIGANYDHLQVYHRIREDKHCPRCGELVERIVIAQRSAHFCPRCQPLSTRVTPE